MKLFLYEILNMSNAIESLANEKVPPRVRYWILKNTRLIREHCAFYEAERKRLTDEYVEKLSDGSYGIVDESGNFILNYKNEESESKYKDELIKLGNLDVEVQPYLLNYEKLIEENPSFMLEAKYELVLDKLIE